MRFKDKIKSNIDPVYFDKLAFIESSNNPKAQAKTSSAAGLYQFTKGTWNEQVKKLGLDYTEDDRFDPDKSRKVVEGFTKQNERFLKNSLDRDVTPSELYLAHFLGMGGSRSLLRAYDEDPSLPVTEVLSDAQINANESVFLNDDGTPKQVKDIYRWSNKKFGRRDGSYDFFSDPDDLFVEENKIENKKKSTQVASI